MKRILVSLFLVAVICGLVVASSPAFADEKPKPAERQKGKKSQEELEKEFEEALSGSVLIGRYSVVGRGDEQNSHEEKYTISKVSKLQDEYWMFETRIQYGKNDLTVPLTLRVVWAEDTPIITLTDLTIPALGTFTSRVMIFRGRYAGTWQHDKVGGHLWGRIEKLDAQENGTKENGDKKEGSDNSNGEKPKK